MLPEQAPPVEPLKPPDHLVHPDNWEAYRVFIACHSQWRIVLGPRGVLYQGLDYPGVVAVMSAWGVKKRRRVFKQIQLIETGALSVINVKQDLPDNAANSG